MRVALLGDMAFFGKNSVSSGGSLFQYYEDIAKYLAKFDHVVGNLETPLCEGLDPVGQKSAYICASPDNVQLMKFLNITEVNLANNHMFDYGRSGYVQTLSSLEKAGIRSFGVDGTEVELIDSSAKVALHGYCSFNTNPLGASRKFGVGLNFLNIPKVSERMLDHDRRGSLNIVSVHSGQEHVNYPSLDDIQMARAFAKNCPYVYYGHHPHVMQGFEYQQNSLIAYSLGNFCFDDVYTDKSREPLIRQTENNRAGLIIELEIEGKSVIDWNVRTIYSDMDSIHLDQSDWVEKFLQYCAALDEDSISYGERREALISEYLEGRRAMRNLKWYLKRLNPNSVGIVLRSVRNQYKYRRNIADFLQRHP